jgi:putative transposase
MRTSVSRYHRHRFPVEIISHCVWLYFRFALSFRDVEEMLAMRGVSLSYETVREWCLKFGQTYANGLRHKSPRPGDRWHLDEGVPQNQRTTPLPLACSGSGWRRIGYSGPE